jgi:transporter family protein
MWILFALLSAFFAALVAIFAKIGIENVNSNLAVAIRTIVFGMILAFVVLGETVTIKTVIGGILIAAGALVLVL